MNQLVIQLNDVLVTEYPVGYAYVFTEGYANSEYIEDIFRKEFPESENLPDCFWEFQKWMRESAFEQKIIRHEIEIPTSFEEYKVYGLNKIATRTNDWKKKSGSKLWRDGFLVILDWNDCYTMVIDTKGKMASKGAIGYFDYKGGSEFKKVYDNYEKYLETIIARLKAKLFFAPSFDNDPEGFELYYDGETREKIIEIQEQINGKEVSIKYESYIKDDQ